MGRKKVRRGKERNARATGSKCSRNCCEETGICEEREETSSGKIIEKPRRETGNVPINVYARLSYPFARSCFSKKSLMSSNDRKNDVNSDNHDDGNDNDNDDEDEEETVELNIKPRFVFVSSLCAVCLRKREICCERCRMVSYCSSAHRSKGLMEHRELCCALTDIYSSMTSTLSDKTQRRLDAEQYRSFRVQLLTALQSKIRRPLKLWETEIVLYPSACRLCRYFRDNLTSCEHCGMECYCDQHAADHQKWCREFCVLQRCLMLQYKHGYVNPRIPNVRQEIRVAEPEIDFDELMMLHVYKNCSYYREMDCYTYSVLSQVCTIPLTALYAMQLSCPVWQSNTDCTIHVIGAEFHFEGINLHAWEKLFLHFLPGLRRLRLTLIGPELRLPNGVPHHVLSKVKLCRGCKSAGRSVVVRFRSGKLYHEAVRDETKPDLLCVFNPGLYRRTGFAGQDTWPETIRVFCEQSVAVAITSYTMDEMFWEIARIRSVSDVDVLLEPRRNPFASVKPDRNFVSDDVNPLIYKNYYISIVRGK